MDERIDAGELARKLRAMFGWSPGQAEKFALESIERIRIGAEKQTKHQADVEKRRRRKLAQVVGKVAEKAKKLTPLQRLERRLGPDDGRRRGGRPTVQGGAPGLKR